MERKKLTRKEKFSQPARKVQDTKPAKTNLSWLPGLIIALTGFLIYSNTLNHGFVLDDYSIILENRLTRQGISAIPEIFSTNYRAGYYITNDNLYRPAVKSVFAILWDISPGNPAPGHWVNVLLYSFTGFVLYKTLLKLKPGSYILSFSVALLFISHPIHTEVVANMKSLDEIMAFLFSMIALERFVSFLRTGKNVSLFMAAVSYFIALLSKESAVTFLAVFPLAGWFFTDSKPISLLKKFLPLAVTAILFLLIRYIVLKDIVPTPPSVADNLLMAAKDQVTRFFTAVFILGLYLKLLIFPHPLAFDYSFNQVPLTHASNPWFLLSLFGYLSMLVYAVVKLKHKDPVSFAVLFYLVTLSVSSNLFIMTGSSMGERFLYTPSFGFALAVGLLVNRLWRFIQKQKVTDNSGDILRNKPVLITVFVICLGYSYATIARNPVWKSNYSLYSHDVHVSPNSTRTHYYLGNYLVKPEAWEGKGEEYKEKILNEGISELRRSIEIYPRFSDAHVQMGVGYFKLNNLDSALACYKRALEINPHHATTLNNIGTIYFTRQQYQESLKYFSEATRFDPSYAEAYANTGSAYGMLGQYDNALANLFEAVRYDPGYAQAYYFIGVTYQFKGDQANAKIYLDKAYQLNPALRPKQ